jgi:hypothetical protein
MSLPRQTTRQSTRNSVIEYVPHRFRKRTCLYSYSVRFEVPTPVVTKSTIFRKITPCSPLKVNRRFGGTYRRWQAEQSARLCLPPVFTLVSCLAYSSTLKMEAKCSSETSVEFQRTTRRYIPEDNTLHAYTQFKAGFLNRWGTSHWWDLTVGWVGHEVSKNNRH